MLLHDATHFNISGFFSEGYNPLDLKAAELTGPWEHISQPLKYGTSKPSASGIEHKPSRLRTRSPARKQPTHSSNMSIQNQLHYHCLIDPTDNSILSQGETALNECTPYEFGNRLIERWGREQLPSMESHETRTLDYFYATNRIRPHRSVATFTKGPIVVVQTVMGSNDPGYEERIPYQFGYEGGKPACYEEFPLPENPPSYLAREMFYDPDAIKRALADCVEVLKTTISRRFNSESLMMLMESTESLVASIGGQGLHPHPVPFSDANEEDNAILLLDVVIFAILNEACPHNIPEDVLLAHKERQENFDDSDLSLPQILAHIKSGAS